MVPSLFLCLIYLSLVSDFHSAQADDARDRHRVRTTARPPLANCQTTRVYFITGINGLIGSHICKAILASRPCVRVAGLVRPRSDLTTLSGLLDELWLLEGDIMDKRRMVDVVLETKPDIIFHFAAQAINDLSNRMPQLTMDVNIHGTMNILDAAVRLGTSPRVLFAGSSAEYGRSANLVDGAISEAVPLEPVTPYGISKMTGEKLVNYYFSQYGIPGITARIFIHMGAGGTNSLALQQFCRQIALAELHLGPATILHGNLASSRDITDAVSSAIAFVSLAELGEPGEAYNVGSGQTTTMDHLLQLAIAKAHVRINRQQDPTRMRAFDEKSLMANISKLQAVTHWVPTTDLNATVVAVLQHWRRKVRELYCRGNDKCTTVEAGESLDAS